MIGLTYDLTLNSSVILSLAAGFLGASGFLWTLIFIYAFFSNAFFLVRLFFMSALPCFFLDLLRHSFDLFALLFSLRHPAYHLLTQFQKSVQLNVGVVSSFCSSWPSRRSFIWHGWWGYEWYEKKVGYFLFLYNEFFPSLIVADCMNYMN